MVCQVDASWREEDDTFGLEFSITDNDGPIFGSKGTGLTLSLLHAELEGRTQALESALTQGYTFIHLEMDCLELIKMVDDVDAWTALSTELDTFICTRMRLSNFTLSSIPRSKNVRTDCLAKEARGPIRTNLIILFYIIL